MAREAEGGAHGYIVTDPERLAALAQEAIAERQRRRSGAYGNGRMVGWNNEGYRWADEHAPDSRFTQPELAEDLYATRVLPTSVLYEGIIGNYPHQQGEERQEEFPTNEYIPGIPWWDQRRTHAYVPPPIEIDQYPTDNMPVMSQPVAWKNRLERLRDWLGQESMEWQEDFGYWKEQIKTLLHKFKKNRS